MSQKIVQKRRLQTLEKHLEIDADLEVPDADQEVLDARSLEVLLELIEASLHICLYKL